MKRKNVASPGDRFGRGKVVREYQERKSIKNSYWFADLICDCGNFYSARVDNLFRGNVKSCGCGFNNRCGDFTYKHGLTNHYVYETWRDINRRCRDPRRPAYPAYGGRGIQVHPAWRKDAEAFIAWVEQNLGPRPGKHWLVRIDGNGNYEPGNIRWSGSKTHLLNQRTISNSLPDDQTLWSVAV